MMVKNVETMPTNADQCRHQYFIINTLAGGCDVLFQACDTDTVIRPCFGLVH